MDKKAQTTMVRTLVILALAFLALFLLWAFYSGQWEKIINAFSGTEEGVIKSLPPPEAP